MDEETKKEVAVFRFGVISEFVSGNEADCLWKAGTKAVRTMRNA